MRPNINDEDADVHLSVAETSLRLDLCDDLQLTQVDLQPLVDVARDLLFRTPRAAVTLRANPAQRVRKQTSCSKLFQIFVVSENLARTVKIAVKNRMFPTARRVLSDPVEDNQRDLWYEKARVLSCYPAMAA